MPYKGGGVPNYEGTAAAHTASAAWVRIPLALRDARGRRGPVAPFVEAHAPGAALKIERLIVVIIFIIIIIIM